MKKIIKVLFTLLIIFVATINVNAISITKEDYESLDIKRAYVVGEYIFDMEYHSPTLWDLLRAAARSGLNDDGDIPIIEIKINENIFTDEIEEIYTILETNEQLDDFPDLDVKYVYRSKILPSTPNEEDKDDLAMIFGFQVNYKDGNTTIDYTTVAENTPVAEPDDPIKQGYTFVSWQVMSEGVLVDYDFSTPVTSNINLYAKFTPNTYNVTFNYNGATANNTTIDKNVIFGNTYGTLPEPIKKGYTFNGWYIDELFDSSISSDSFVETFEDHDLYAKYTLDNYTINYNLDDGILSEEVTNPSSYTINTNTITLNNPTKVGYKFLGWTGSNSVTPETEVIITQGTTGNKTYTANWEIETYTINYDLADGELDDETTNPSSYTVETIAFTLNNPTKAGYEFIGWTGSNGVTPETGATITQGTTGNKTYTANWEIKTYTINYNLDGGVLAEGIINPSSYTVETTTFTLNNPTKSGYEFDGWKNSLNETVTTIIQGSTGNIELTANWVGKTYTISFDSNGGDTISATTATYNTAYGELPIPVRNEKNWNDDDKYKFDGWYINEEDNNGTGTKVTSDTIVSILDNQTLYAKWLPSYIVCPALQRAEANDCQIQGSECETRYAEAGTLIVLTEDDLAPRTGFRINNFMLHNNYVNADSSQEVQIQFIRNTYSIEYYVDGISIGSNTYKYGAQTVKYSTTPEKEGYTFKEWVDSEGNPYIFGTMPAENVTLYASWTGNKYNLIFDTNGGVSLDSIEVTNGLSYGELPVPVKENFGFGGWYTSEESDNGTGTEVTNDTMVDISDNQTLYAKWLYKYQICNAYEVAEGGGLTTDVESCQIKYAELGSIINIAPSSIIVPEHYYLNTYGLNNNIVTADGSLEIYIGFMRTKYKMTFDVDGDVSRYVMYKHGQNTSAWESPPEKDQYIFAGWVDSEGNPYTFGTMPTENVTVYASWNTDN